MKMLHCGDVVAERGGRSRSSRRGGSRELTMYRSSACRIATSSPRARVQNPAWRKWRLPLKQYKAAALG